MYYTRSLVHLAGACIHLRLLTSTISHQDGTIIHHGDNAHDPSPNYHPFMISSPDHPFFLGAPVSQCHSYYKYFLTIFMQIMKQMFKDLYQIVFSIIILCTWTLVPAILKAEVGRHIKMVALKNNISGKLSQFAKYSCI